MSYVFYDTETTGTNTTFDQILQFAAVRTDADFNVIDHFEIRCRLLPHIVPAPGAMRVTGVTVEDLLNSELPSHYMMVRAICDKLLSWGPAIFLGYNSLTFDENLLRQALYQTLHAPYLTNTNGNCRADLYRIAQAAALFVPEALIVPTDENGKILFKLEYLAPANGFDHANAHDARGDVEATIYMCKLISERAPALWSNCMRFAQKRAVLEHVTNEPVFCFADFFRGRPYSGLVTYLASSSSNASDLFVYDLATDPDELRDLPDKKLARRIARSSKIVRHLKANGCPIIMPVEDAPAGTVAAELGQPELERRAQTLRDDPDLVARLCACEEEARDEYGRSEHVEKQIYDSFILDEDKPHLDAFHISPWEQRATILEKLQDKRLQRLGKRLIYVEHPECLVEAERSAIALELAQRVSTTDKAAPWLTVHKAIESADELIAKSQGDEAIRLKAHRSYLVCTLTAATKLLR